MARPTGPTPTPPKTVKYPWVDFIHRVNPKKSQSFPPSSCFYYAGMQAIWVTWEVEFPVLRRYLRPRRMRPARFGDQGAINVCFFNAACLFGNASLPPDSPRNSGVYGFNETEVNIVAYAAAVERNVPMDLTLASFLTNGDQTKRIGVYRLWVAADDEAAVAAGRKVYYENKFLASYSYGVPTWNNPGASTYDWTCYDAKDERRPIYSGSVNLAGLSPVPGNTSEWVDLSYSTADNRVVGSRRNFFGTSDTYLLSPAQTAAVSIKFGNSPHPMRRDMETLIGDRLPSAIQVFRSPPVIAESTPYWADL